MRVSEEDLRRLRSGQPPVESALLREITVDEPGWLEAFAEHCLSNFIAQGGSKVKILTGSQGSGKTHCLRWIEDRAKQTGYVVVSLSMSNADWKFSKMDQIYKQIIQQIDLDALVDGLARHAAGELGYGPDKYKGGSILPLMLEEEGATTPDANKAIRACCVKAFSEMDLNQSFKSFAATVVRSRLTDSAAGMETCRKWLSGEKLTTSEKKDSALYERLTRQKARQWLYSLLSLIRFSGRTGLVLLVDDLEAITERFSGTAKFLYTPNAAKDTFELIRQLIDDAELLENLLVVFSGRPEIITDEKRGFMSYEALWMRLQTGLATSPWFNRLADILNLDILLDELGEGFFESVGKRISEVLDGHGLMRIPVNGAPLERASLLQIKVSETAMSFERRDA